MVDDPARRLREVLALGESTRRLMRDLDDAVHGIFQGAYLPSTNSGAIASEYNALVDQAKLPICSLVVKAVTDRLQVEGVRGLNEQADDVLWYWWQYSKLDSRQIMLFNDALTYGDAYLSVTPSELPGVPLFMPESPLALAVEHDPMDPLRVLSAAKQIKDDAWLYTADTIYWFQRTPGSAQWNIVQQTPHSLGVCPVVRFPNRLDTIGRSESEIVQVMPIQRRIHQTIFTRLLLEATAAWKQRWVSGIDVEENDEGVPIPPFRAGVDNLWVSDDADTKFGEFQASSTADLLEAIEHDLRHASVVSQTPPTLFAVTSISNISAESLAVLEGGLARKIQTKQAMFGEAFEYAMRLAGGLVGVEVPENLEMIWGNFEVSSLSQQSNALVQLRSAGMPLGFLLEHVMRLTPATIQRVLDMAASEAAMLGPVTPPSLPPLGQQRQVGEDYESV